MSKLLRLTGIILSASMIFISLPSQTKAEQAVCYGAIVWKEEKFCLEGTYYIKTYYTQTCKYSDGKQKSHDWVDVKSYNGCPTSPY